MAIEKKTVDELFVKMWNGQESKSKIILAVYDLGLTVGEVNSVFQRYGVKMIYNHCYNVISKARKDIRTNKQTEARAELKVK